jgi:hypothetical protein
MVIRHGWHTSDEIWYRIVLALPLGLICAIMFVDHFNEAFMIFLGFSQLIAIVIAFVCKDRGGYNPTPATSSDGVHIVLTSQYKEERWMLERLIDSVQANKTSWPVYVVIAAERGSNLVRENWDMQAKYQDLNVHVAIHERGIPGERPGLGSNLHNAIKYINTTLPIDPTKAIVTKLDGNCFVTNTLLSQVESTWKVGDESVVFQLLLEEIDPKTEEYKHIPFSLKYGFVGYLTRWLPYGNLLVPGGVGLVSVFCIPLQLVNNYGNWDPWIIQEDNLTWSRTVAGASSFPRFKFIKSEVFNASPMNWYDQFKQLERSHGQSLRAKVIMYSNMNFCSMRIFYFLTGVFMDITGRWQGLYTVAFILQQLTGFYTLDWRIWLALLTIQAVTVVVSALHQTEVHRPASFMHATWIFLTFATLQIPIGIGLSLFNVYIYIRGWITCESCETYHTTGVVAKKMTDENRSLDYKLRFNDFVFSNFNFKFHNNQVKQRQTIT